MLRHLMVLFSQYTWLCGCDHSHHHGLTLTEQFFFQTKWISWGKRAQRKHACNLLHLNSPDKRIALFIETFCFMLGTVLSDSWRWKYSCDETEPQWSWDTVQVPTDGMWLNWELAADPADSRARSRLLCYTASTTHTQTSTHLRM